MAGANVELIGLPEVVLRLDRANAAITNPRPMLDAAKPAAVGAIKRNFEAGGRPSAWAAKKEGGASHLKKDGRLAGSVNGRIDGNSIFVGPAQIDYAAIHQFGGRIGPIVPRNKKCLRFVSGGKTIFAKRVESITIPARPYLVIVPEEQDSIILAMKNYLQSQVKQ